MPIYDLNGAQIHAIAPSTFARGESYFHDGAVLEVTERGDHYFAQVQGSDDEPYHVHVHLSDEAIETWTCSCPYEWDGACKHVVAVLLTLLHAGDEIDVRPPLDALLAGLDAPQLRRLVLVWWHTSLRWRMWWSRQRPHPHTVRANAAHLKLYSTVLVLCSSCSLFPIPWSLFPLCYND